MDMWAYTQYKLPYPENRKLFQKSLSGDSDTVTFLQFYKAVDEAVGAGQGSDGLAAIFWHVMSKSTGGEGLEMVYEVGCYAGDTVES
jgi:hypothetical protein